VTLRELLGGDPEDHQVLVRAGKELVIAQHPFALEPEPFLQSQ
jgi:hypothetical protein